MFKFLIGVAIGYIVSDIISAKVPEVSKYKISPNLLPSINKTQEQLIQEQVGIEQLRKEGYVPLLELIQ